MRLNLKDAKPFKRSFLGVILLLSITLGSFTMAHEGGHAPPPPKLSDKQLEEKAIKDLGIIVDQKEPVEKTTLDKSWKSVRRESIKIHKKQGYM